METRTTQKNSNTEKQSRQTNTGCSSATLLGNWSSKNYLTAWTPLGIRRHKHLCIFIFKCINGLIDFDFKLNTIAFIVITQEQAKTYIYQKPTQTGENKNQPTKSQRTSTTSITRLKTDSLPKFKTFLKKLTVKKLHWKKLIVLYCNILYYNTSVKWVNYFYYCKLLAPAPYC